MKKYIILSLLALTFFIYGKSLWKDTNLFSSRSALKVGDIIKIRFNYKSVIRYRNAMKTGNTSKTQLGKPGISFFAFLPAVNLNRSTSRDVKVDYSTEKEFKTVLAAVVRRLEPNNILQLEATHIIFMNGQQETITISGKVRLQDLRPGNTVFSTDIAGLTFRYSGPARLQRNMLRARDLVYSSTNTNLQAGGRRATMPKLSDAMRQRLILDYLNRIASLLFRR